MDYDGSIVMMSLPEKWPLERLPLKRATDTAMEFAFLDREGVSPCRIRNDDGSIRAEYANAFEAVDDGWRVD